MPSSTRIYLDYAATTPCDPAVIEAMLPYFNDVFGNPSSIHRDGQKSWQAVEKARKSIATALNCNATEIVFTSGGSESDNLALRGAVLAATVATPHLITTNVEHHAIGHTVSQLAEEFGCTATYLPVNKFGLISAQQVAEAIRPETVIVSVIYANNEIGTIQPIAEIAEVCRAADVLLHIDAVQAGSQLELDVDALGVDLMSLGAHKFYGPKGVGVLYIRNGTAINVIQTGGAQENGMRAGTHNVPLIIGMGKAIELVQKRRAAYNAHVNSLRDQLIDRVLSEFEDVQLTGHPTNRLPNHASFVFNNVDGNALLMHLDMAGISASSGSACSTGNPEPSAVIKALGYSESWQLGSLRLTVGRDTTQDHIDAVLSALHEIVPRLRSTEARVSAVAV